VAYDLKHLPKKVTKKDVPKVPGAFVLHNVLTREECAQFVELTEKMGYGEAPISVGIGVYEMAKGVRNNKRVIWQAEPQMLDVMWDRVKGSVPQVIKSKITEWSPAFEWKACGLNERLRFYRYTEGEEFKKHFDGCYPRTQYEMSMMTFIVYLNEGMEGGETTFFLDYSGKKKVPVNPVSGSALVFFHGAHEDSPLHEGSLLRKGSKYVLRSDVMYRREKPKKEGLEKSS